MNYRKPGKELSYGGIYGAKGVVKTALDKFVTGDIDKSRAVTGIPPVDRKLGGMFAGEVGILAASTGAGKSSVALHSVMESGGLYISCEDSQAVVGTRILSHITGIDSLKIRKGDLTDEERSTMMGASKVADGASFSFHIGSSMETIAESIKAYAATQDKPRTVWLDYIQCISGGGNDRRNEVANIFRDFRTACARNNMAGIAISQFRRGVKEGTFPSRYHLKESGDLENEARLILLGYRDNSGDSDTLRFRIDKSTFGGEGLTFSYRRNEAGKLYYVKRAV